MYPEEHVLYCDHIAANPARSLFENSTFGTACLLWQIAARILRSHAGLEGIERVNRGWR